MLTGGTVSDGNCLTSDDGCCDLVSECRDDGTCQLPPPVCTTDDTCDGVNDVCAQGQACMSVDDVDITLYETGSAPYLGVVRYNSQEFFLVGTGDTSSGDFVIEEFVTFDEGVGGNVHVVVDPSRRPLSAYVEGSEDEMITYTYDANGNLVSAVVQGGSDGGERSLRGLEKLSAQDSSPALLDGTRRELQLLTVTIAAVFNLGNVLIMINVVIEINLVQLFPGEECMFHLPPDCPSSGRN